MITTTTKKQMKSDTMVSAKRRSKMPHEFPTSSLEITSQPTSDGQACHSFLLFAIRRGQLLHRTLFCLGGPTNTNAGCETNPNVMGVKCLWYRNTASKGLGGVPPVACVPEDGTHNSQRSLTQSEEEGRNKFRHCHEKDAALPVYCLHTHKDLQTAPEVLWFCVKLGGRG